MSGDSSSTHDRPAGPGESGTPVNWVASAGGPLLLLPERLLSAWEGSDKPRRGRRIEATSRWNARGPATDYDRACDVRDYVGVIRVGEGFGLVLGDEPLATTWIPSDDADGGVLVRWVHAQGDDEVEVALMHAADQQFGPTNGVLRVDDPRLVLFDSALSGTNLLTPSLVIEIPAGDYRVETARLEPDPETSLLLHRLVRVRKASKQRVPRPSA